MLEIGKSGIKVPFLGLGTWAIGGGTWWGPSDDALSIQTIEEAIDRGIVWIDTAPIYGIYHSEEVVGKAIRGKRDKIVLSTKCGLQWRHETSMFHTAVDGETVYRDLSRQSIMDDLDHSLLTLGTDYIDVYYTHWQTKDPSVYPYEETMDALMTLKKQGKIRAIGASNVTADDIEGYCRYGQLDVIQEKYSLAARRIETELVPLCQKKGISVQAYSPLEQGLFTGKVTMDTTVAEGDTRGRNPNWQPERRRQILAMMEGWKPLCEKYGCSMGNLVIAATAAMIPGLFVLCGARKPEQLRDNVKAMDLHLEEEDLEKIKASLV